MRVKVGDTWYDSSDVPVMVVLDERNKRHLRDMPPDCYSYAEFPDDASYDNESKRLEWMNEGRQV